jgi:hypothetical protein
VIPARCPPRTLTVTVPSLRPAIEIRAADVKPSLHFLEFAHFVSPAVCGGDEENVRATIRPVNNFCDIPPISFCALHNQTSLRMGEYSHTIDSWMSSSS